ncbi:uncharacterized protein VTP21DRAFT_7724 [Calcarisporiella thermophila]|uniref:uncharacterized protein n=1 Tax=Calcarisporiella thermophila TaxID=911321 RepID=UPI003742ECD8
MDKRAGNDRKRRRKNKASIETDTFIVEKEKSTGKRGGKKDKKKNKKNPAVLSDAVTGAPTPKVEALSQQGEAENGSAFEVEKEPAPQKDNGESEEQDKGDNGDNKEGEEENEKSKEEDGEGSSGSDEEDKNNEEGGAFEVEKEDSEDEKQGREEETKDSVPQTEVAEPTNTPIFSLLPTPSTTIMPTLTPLFPSPSSDTPAMPTNSELACTQDPNNATLLGCMADYMYCDEGSRICLPKLTAGASCTMDKQCSTENCAGGFCSDKQLGGKFLRVSNDYNGSMNGDGPAAGLDVGKLSGAIIGAVLGVALLVLGVRQVRKFRSGSQRAPENALHNAPKGGGATRSLPSRDNPPSFYPGFPGQQSNKLSYAYNTRALDSSLTPQNGGHEVAPFASPLKEFESVDLGKNSQYGELRVVNNLGVDIDWSTSDESGVGGRSTIRTSARMSKYNFLTQAISQMRGSQSSVGSNGPGGYRDSDLQEGRDYSANSSFYVAEESSRLHEGRHDHPSSRVTSAYGDQSRRSVRTDSSSLLSHYFGKGTFALTPQPPQQVHPNQPNPDAIPRFTFASMATGIQSHSELPAGEMSYADFGTQAPPPAYHPDQEDLGEEFRRGKYETSLEDMVTALERHPQDNHKYQYGYF